TDVQTLMTAAAEKTAVQTAVLKDDDVQTYAGKTDTDKTWAELESAVAASKTAIENKKAEIEA
ncbi:MAG: hypothetical protein II073_05125, partial [Lachnospiraceae bacterium]|nr:hypothetical protein [Lachnospiraceae bacterium]